MVTLPCQEQSDKWCEVTVGAIASYFKSTT